MVMAGARTCYTESQWEAIRANPITQSKMTFLGRDGKRDSSEGCNSRKMQTHFARTFGATGWECTFPDRFWEEY
jgi:hypothetical protein